jgi:hypothetical protein
VEHATTPEVVTINGQRMRVVDPETGLPPSLTTLLTAMRVTTQRQVVIRGYSSECADNHPLVDWLTGSFEDMDLRILVCQACALVEVHDVSTNAITLPNGMVLPAAPTAVGPQRRGSPRQVSRAVFRAAQGRPGLSVAKGEPRGNHGDHA